MKRLLRSGNDKPEARQLVFLATGQPQQVINMIEHSNSSADHDGDAHLKKKVKQKQKQFAHLYCKKMCSDFSSCMEDVPVFTTRSFHSCETSVETLMPMKRKELGWWGTPAGVSTKLVQTNPSKRPFISKVVQGNHAGYKLP